MALQSGFAETESAERGRNPVARMIANDEKWPRTVGIPGEYGGAVELIKKRSFGTDCHA
jgi:hypothetical protein